MTSASTSASISTGNSDPLAEPPAPGRASSPAGRRSGAMGMARVAVVLLLFFAVLAPISTDSAGAADNRPLVVVDGRGWGHGRGMSQYGALGYATNFGWTSSQILDHYYGGTTAGLAPIPGVVDPRQVRVDLVYMRSRSTAVALGSGTIHLMASDGSTLRRLSGAVRLTVSGGSMTVATAPGCAGPWVDEAPIDRSLVRIEAEGAGAGQAGLLQVCGPSYSAWYEGEVWTTSSAGKQHAINVVSVEEYLRGVVPNEVPAGWVSAALEAQAVAARSYVLAGDTRWSGYADTCDTTLCQVYDGRYTTRGAGLRTSTHARTDAAISGTAGLVRLKGNGAVARTEFSSSSGGYTAGGDFPAVADEGDSVSANGNSRWQVTVDLRSLESAYDRGPIIAIAVTERNGLGADGGRAVAVKYTFTNGSVTVDGDRARRHFGLKSNWFSFGPLTRGGVVVDADGSIANARFVDQAFQRLNGRTPTTEEVGLWQDRLRDGSRLDLTRELVHGQHFAGTLIDELYLTALGRPADAAGRTYWVDTMAAGLKYEHLGTLFYGSTEYVRRAGNGNEGFLTSLYFNVLGRPPDGPGRAYWLEQLNSGRAAPVDVANAFYRSVESRRDRSASAHRRVMGTDPTAQQIAAGADRLLVVDDLTLAAELATALGA